MTDINKLKELAVRALPFAPGEWFVENGIDQVRDCANDFVCETGEDEPIKASFIAAANPQAILKLIAEVDLLSARLKAENEALRKDAERWRYARTILPYEAIQDAQKDLEIWNVGVSEAENKRCDEAIDAALEGATQ